MSHHDQTRKFMQKQFAHSKKGTNSTQLWGARAFCETHNRIVTENLKAAQNVSGAMNCEPRAYAFRDPANASLTHKRWVMAKAARRQQALMIARFSPLKLFEHSLEDCCCCEC